MEKYICDDRENTPEYVRMIQNMTDEEFEAHLKTLSKKEHEDEDEQ